MRILSEGPDGRLQPIEGEPFDLESKLQGLLAEHPDLALAGTVDDESIEIWTIGMEVQTAAGSIDLLLLDSTGKLWVVETKLARNPEIKKQVVGQVLGYGSCIAEWTSDTIAATASNYLASHGKSLESLAGGEPDRLIETAAERAADGDLTCLIVVDEIPSELQRLVEFVNRHARFELLALKVEVATHKDGRLFIPTVSGRLAERREARATGPRATRQWDRESFLATLAQHQPDALAPAEQLLDWAEASDHLVVSWGSGAVHGTAILTVWMDAAGDDWVQVLNLSTNGYVGGGWVWRGKHQHAAWWDPFPAEIEALSGVAQTADRAKGFPITALADPDVMTQLQTALARLVERIPLVGSE